MNDANWTAHATDTLLMPPISPSMKEATLAQWLVNEGDFVEPGQIIAEFETDKAIIELESHGYWKIGSLTVKAGQTGVRVGAVLALLIRADPVSYNRSKIRLVH